MSSVFRMKPKYVLTVTPIFDILTLLMGFAFMYSFTLVKQAEYFYGAVEIFRWLYLVGFILLFRGAIIKDDLEVTRKEFFDIFMWTLIGILGIGFVNVGVSIFAKSFGLMSITQLTLNYAVVDDLVIAWLAGYNEEIAFAGIYFIIFRLSADRYIKIGRFTVNTAHLITMWAVAMLFPLYHSIAYNIWGPVFVVLFFGRLILTEVLIRSKRIEPAILAHAIWDVITILPALFILG